MRSTFVLLLCQSHRCALVRRGFAALALCGFAATASAEAKDLAGAERAATVEEAEVAAPPAEARSLIEAIREGRVVRFRYQGHEREVEPHSFGVAPGGEAVLHGYQIGGGSSSGRVPGWRTFTFAEMSAIEATGKRVEGPRSDYAAGRPRLAPMWAELAAGE